MPKYPLNHTINNCTEKIVIPYTGRLVCVCVCAHVRAHMCVRVFE